ncbi:uncharacterized protein LOC130546386 [Triplophysa rosa]|uniref:uncharacterized protein LOC130546386 n=1 Tax=Triplophysa rosa TaxID=992332 RepID=UPI002545C8B1|nr:uncharacterized protein LOC130546386 [Triplophysa rosa]
MSDTSLRSHPAPEETGGSDWALRCTNTTLVKRTRYTGAETREGGRRDTAIMQAASGTPFADIIASLAVLHREQHQALLDLRSDHELRFQTIFQAQREDRESFRSWMGQGVRAEASAPVTTAAFLPLSKMGPEDDPEAFLDLFEKTAETSGWPPEDWARRLLPLLSGEAQLAARPLPVQNLLVFDDLKRAILQRVGRSPEEHRQRFRTLGLGESGRPFVMAHQLRDSCRK